MSEKTTKKGTKTHGVAIETSTPTGHEEIESRWAEEATGDGASPDPLQPKRTTKEHREQEPDQPLNPKKGGKPDQERESE